MEELSEKELENVAGGATGDTVYVLNCVKGTYKYTNKFSSLGYLEPVKVAKEGQGMTCTVDTVKE